MAERSTMPEGMRAAHGGSTACGVEVVPVNIATAWNVQGDATRASFAEEARRQFGVALPTAANTFATAGGVTALWVGPASWLLVAGAEARFVDFDAKRDAINAAGGALFDVSASRVAWTMRGPRATEVLAKGCPLDLHPRAFAAGTCAQSLYGHINVLVAKHDDAPTFTVMAGRSFARDLWHALVESAAQYGCEVREAGPSG